MTDNTKPPAQVMAPAGIDGFKPMGGSGAIDVERLARHPPYQSYVVSREPNLIGATGDAYALQRTMAAIDRGELEAWLSKYEQWHAERGYWVGEDPWGGAKA